MERFSRLLFIAALLFSLTGHRLQSQCSGGSAAGALSPAPAAAWQTQAVVTGNYYTFTVPPATGCSFPTYFFSFCAGDGGSAGFDSQITLLDNTGAYAGGYSDDYCGLQSFVQWTPTAAGTYRVLLNTYYCGSGSGATLAYRMQAPPPADPYFSVLVDAASLGSGCVQLTSATNGLRGCAWDVDNTLDFNAAFVQDFTVNLGSNPGGADGMSFVIQNAPAGRCACGLPGGALGSSGIPNSLIIEIDTYLNAEDRDDGMAGVLCAGGPEPDHLDVWLNGNVNPPGAACPGSPGARIIPAAVKLMDGGLDYEVENGLNHLFRVSWTPGAPGTLTASLYNSTGLTLYGTVSYAFNPVAVFGTNTPFFGFTAATGGLNNQHTFCQQVVLSQNDGVQLAGAEINKKVKLHWLLPVGYQYHSVEHSGDGVHWQPLDASGLNLSSLAQEATDENPAWEKNHYRITAFRDGFTITSNTVEVSVAPAYQLQVFPNPVNPEGGNASLTVMIPAGLESGILFITDLAGKVVTQQAVSGEKQVLSLEGMARGNYIVQVRGSDHFYSARITVE